MVRTLELQVKDVTTRYDEFSREFDKAESKITEMSSKLKKVKNEKENAEDKVERQRKEMRKMAKQIHSSQVREQQEVQILSEMLSMTLSPSNGAKAREAVASPQSRRDSHYRSSYAH